MRSAPTAVTIPTVNPDIANEFSTAAYRFGHSMLSSELVRLDADGSPSEEGPLSLQVAFFNPAEIYNPDEGTGNGIDSLLRGMTTTVAQEIDTQVVDDVRNFLFGPPGAGGFDLAALNIQRGRDHGLSELQRHAGCAGIEAGERLFRHFLRSERRRRSGFHVRQRG